MSRSTVGFAIVVESPCARGMYRAIRKGLLSRYYCKVAHELTFRDAGSYDMRHFLLLLFSELILTMLAALSLARGFS